MTNLKRIIDEMGVQQRWLAEQVGVTEVSMSRYVNGERIPKAPLAIRMADVLGVDIRELYGWDDEIHLSIEDAQKVSNDSPELDSDFGDLISRQAAVDAVEFGITYAKAIDVNTGEGIQLFEEGNDALKKAVERIKDLPLAKAETHDKRMETHACDPIDRQSAINIVVFECGEWTGLAKEISKQLKQLPSAQPVDKDIYVPININDTISRQAAIDIERNATVDTNPSHFVAHQKFIQFLDDAEISSFGRWQWSNGFNTALTAVGIDLEKLPSAQPEIIRCGECKYMMEDGRCYEFADDNIRPSASDFCSYAERRTDG